MTVRFAGRDAPALDARDAARSSRARASPSSARAAPGRRRSPACSCASWIRSAGAVHDRRPGHPRRPRSRTCARPCAWRARTPTSSRRRSARTSCSPAPTRPTHEILAALVAGRPRRLDRRAPRRARHAGRRGRRRGLRRPAPADRPGARVPRSARFLVLDEPTAHLDAQGARGPAPRARREPRRRRAASSSSRTRSRASRTGTRSSSSTAAASSSAGPTRRSRPHRRRLRRSCSRRADTRIACAACRRGSRASAADISQGRSSGVRDSGAAPAAVRLGCSRRSPTGRRRSCSRSTGTASGAPTAVGLIGLAQLLPGRLRGADHRPDRRPALAP